MSTTTPERTIVASHNRFVLFIVITLIIGLASGAFVLSFDALHALAVASAIKPELAWIWPIIIDGFIVTATIAIFSLRGRGRTWYPWAALVLFAFVSVFGNSIHAVNHQDELGVSVWIASSVSAAPAIALLLASHFLVIMISAPKDITVGTINVHGSSEPDKIIGTTTIDEPFQEPRIRTELTQPLVVNNETLPKDQKVVESEVESQTHLDDFGFDSIEKTFKQDNKTVEPEVETVQKKETNTSVSSVKKLPVSDDELIVWLKANNKDMNISKLSETFNLSERTIHRRMRKLKDQYGENLETL